MDGIAAVFQNREVLLDGFAAGILIVDLCFNSIESAFGFLVSGGEGFVFFVVICLALSDMGVLVDAVLYQPRNNIQLIGQLCFFLLKGGGVKDRMGDFLSQAINEFEPASCDTEVGSFICAGFAEAFTALRQPQRQKRILPCSFWQASLLQQIPLPL